MIVFGNIGSKGQINGQVVKTKEVIALLNSQGENFSLFDTSSNSPIRMILQIIKNKDKCHVICLGKKGLFLYYISSFFFANNKIKRVFVVVGGWLPQYIKKFYINKFARNLNVNSIYLVESNELINELTEISYKADYLSNFRLNLSNGLYFEKVFKNEIRLVFLSRLTSDKGVFEAINLADSLNKRGVETTLNIYGVGTSNEILAVCNSVSNNSKINFCGMAKPSEASTIISQSHFLVLPTRYPGECMPGVVVESFSSGTPVISSDWRYMPEMVIHDRTGGIFSLDSFVELACDWLSSMNSEKYVKLQEECFVEYGKRFSPNAAALVLMKHIKS